MKDTLLVEEQRLEEVKKSMRVQSLSSRTFATNVEEGAPGHKIFTKDWTDGAATPHTRGGRRSCGQNPKTDVMEERKTESYARHRHAEKNGAPR